MSGYEKSRSVCCGFPFVMLWILSGLRPSKMTRAVSIRHMS